MKLKPKLNLTRLSIARKFVLLGAVLAMSFAIITGTFLFTSTIQKDSQHTLVKTNDEAALFAKVQYTLEAARVAIGNFFVTRDMEYAKDRAAKMVEVDKMLKRLADNAKDEETRRLILKPLDALRVNQVLVEEAVQHQVDLGLNENLGLQGKLRDAVHNIENRLNKQTGVDKLKVSMLMLRRHEKDFILREKEKYTIKHAKQSEKLRRLIANAKLPGGTKRLLQNDLVTYVKTFREFAELTKTVRASQAKYEKGFAEVDPELVALKKATTAISADTLAKTNTTTRVTTTLFYAVIGISAAFVAIMAFLMVRGILRSVGGLRGAVAALAEGQLDARANVKSGDELGELGSAFDNMIEERGKFMQTEEENEMLNNSVIGILRSVSQLGKGDLTILAPVNEDITGALADAINQMSGGISNTLGQVNSASQQVRSASEEAKNITTESKETVLSTAKGMGEIRGTIQETAKRIKRLGERSQEIGGIVKLIDDIAERTNVLALNANMQAAQAGEAGRGFMVVADEVQRLAESSKQATDQISKLINNIQMETGDTISTMDKAIEEVVHGGELAEQAAAQMEKTEQTVATLDALGAQLAQSVSAFKLPESARQATPPATAQEPLKAVG